MNIKTVLVAIILESIALFAYAQDGWKPANLRLSTKWSNQVSPANALPEYPRPQMVRSEWMNLNGLWNYAITDSTTFRPNNYQGKILVPYPLESALSGIQRPLQPTEKLWYQRTFDLKEKKNDKRYLLHLGAVDYRATVFVNGKEVGGHTGGYQTFSLDITGAVQAGANDITVAVTDPTNKGDNPHGKQILEPQGIMYTSTSGIWQTVWLEPVPNVGVDALKITPDIDKSQLHLTVDVTGYNKNYAIETKVGDKTLRFAQQNNIAIPIPNAHLWSPSDPYLYDLSVRLLYKGKVVDSVLSYFGMRKIEIKKDKDSIDRIFLNNQYTFNLGVLDQGFWPDGIYTAPTDEALKYDVEAIKGMGFNTIRKHIKIEPARWYYWCDKLGMLVWQDMPYPANLSANARAEFERENEENIRQLYNYPSIICWVLFNEGWNAYDQQRLTDWMKKEDPSRLVNGHTGANYCRDCPKDAAQRWISSDMVDIHDYPGPGIASTGLPSKAMALGEWGGVKVPMPDHEWNASGGWGYIQSNGNDFARKYGFMIKHLKLFEEEGLSAAIYTQPFDVEIEENGLITYDRALFKIPQREIKGINGIIFQNSTTTLTHK
jgi:beta-galactosidase/beta-glucuronidase